MPTTGKDLSIYFHIPFCKKKCPYCQFYSIYPSQDLENSLILVLKKHIHNNKSILDQSNIISIYFGGGTPSLLKIESIESLLNNLNYKKDIEITLEANPEDITKRKIALFRKIGINRISLGVQSFDDYLLKQLGRAHSSKKAKEIIFNIFDVGIKNISVDLMYEIMNQTLTSFQNTLKIVQKLPITHISLYNLTFEKNTPFYRNKKTLVKQVPTQEESLEILNQAVIELEKMGFQRYEISAFAKENKLSKHNIGYWLGRDFLGFGPSSFSYYNQMRFQNVGNLKKYIKDLRNKNSPISFSEQLKYPKNINELLAINLRLIKGVNIIEFEKRFGKIPKESLKILKNSSYIDFNKDNIRLNEKGLLFYDETAAEII